MKNGISQSGHPAEKLSNYSLHNGLGANPTAAILTER
jgi:hypothetical protein